MVQGPAVVGDLFCAAAPADGADAAFGHAFAGRRVFDGDQGRPGQGAATSAVGDVALVFREQVQGAAAVVHQHGAHGLVEAHVHGGTVVHCSAVGGDHEPNATPVLAQRVAGILVGGVVVQGPAVVGDLAGAVFALDDRQPVRVHAFSG